MRHLLLAFLTIVLLYVSPTNASETEKVINQDEDEIELRKFFSKPLTKKRMEYFFTNPQLLHKVGPGYDYTEDYASGIYNAWFNNGGSEYASEMEQLVCYATEHHKGSLLIFSPIGGGRSDGRTPVCSKLSIENRVPSIKPLINLMYDLTGLCCGGTITYSKLAVRNMAMMNAGLNLEISDFGRDIGTIEFLSKEKLESDQLLEDWSHTGVWEKEQYKKLRSLQKKAIPDMAKFYKNTFNLSEKRAKKRAIGYIKGLQEKSFWGSLDTPSSLVTAIVEHSPLSTIKDLIKDLSTSEENPELTEAIHQSAPYYTEALKELLQLSPESVDVQNKFGKTALMYAIQYRNIKSIKLLLQYKANVNLNTCTEDDCQEKFGFFSMYANLKAYDRSPLMYAAWHGNLEIIKILLAAGADVRSKDSNNDLAYNYLKKNKDLNTQDLKGAEDLLRVLEDKKN